MTGGVLFLRLAAAALMSGAAAGLILFGAALAGYSIVQAPGPWQAFDALPGLVAGLGSMSVYAAVAGMVLAGVPAFFAGAALWLAGRARRRLRPWPVWAGAGGAVGLAYCAVFLASSAPVDSAALAFAGAFALAGAGAALAFRAAMPAASAAPSGSLRRGE